MYWLMVCRHHPGQDARRAEMRDAHRAHVLAGRDGVRVLIGSALTGDDATVALGNFGVLEAPDRSAALAFAEADPYARAGIVADIEITALASTFQAHRIDPMTVAAPPRRDPPEAA
ncbi:MAG: YciI family protein [Siculibacillus sp.]|nr:YciI family protein [Siculibacillus sp.]